MEKLVISILMLLLCLFPKEVYSQKQTFRLKPLDKIKGAGDEFHRLLTKNIDTSNYDCVSTWSIFYFRVNSNGFVDSIRFEGNLRKDIEEQIVKNIYDTKGHWLIPASTKKNQKCWFIYPFFDLSDGPDNKCSDADKVIRKNLLLIVHEMQRMKYFFEQQSLVEMIEPEYGLSTE